MSSSQVQPPKRRRRGPIRPQNPVLKNVYEYALLFVGAFIMAITFNMLLVPNNIASGGTSGLSIVFYDVFGWTPAITQYAFNIPLFVLGVIFLGKQYGIRTFIGSIALPTFTYLTDGLPSVTDNPLLAAIFGGIGIGVGLGVVFAGRGSTGGNSITAQLLNTFSGISLAMSIAICDGVIILLAGILISFEAAMYALIALFVTSKTIDVMQLGFGYSKLAHIITDKNEELSEAILHDLDRGLTKLHGEGGYTGEGRQVLMVVVGQTEIAKLKNIVRSVDPSAFVIISDTKEVFGEGFKMHT